jgi:hypothetical protein
MCIAQSLKEQLLCQYMGVIARTLQCFKVEQSVAKRRTIFASMKHDEILITKFGEEIRREIGGTVQNRACLNWPARLCQGDSYMA